MQYDPGAEPQYATMYRAGRAIPEFARRCELIEVPPSINRGIHPLLELRLLLAILGAARRRRALLLYSSQGRLRVELLATILIGLLMGRRRPVLILYGEMFEPDSGLRGQLQRLIIQLADRWTDGYIVYSRDECESFAKTWGVARAKLRTCGHYHKPKVFPPSTTQGDYIFAGGNSFRDYGPLISAAHALGDVPLLIGTTRLGVSGALPPNVRVWWPNLQEWSAVMAGAIAVVVPLCKGMRRSVGLLLIFEAMWLSRVVIVSESLGIREYVEDGVTGLVVDGSADGYLRALRWANDPLNAASIAEMGRQARRVMEERFTLARHTEQLLAVLDELTSVACSPQQ